MMSTPSSMAFAYRAKPLGGRDENDADENHNVLNEIGVRRTEIPQNPAELLQYYKDRIELFNQERKEYGQKLEDCAISREEYYKLRWELNQRDTEIAELQKALSDAHVYLYDEREHVLQLQAECDELKVQELEDRRRIQHLLALTQPVTQEVTYFRDCRPTAVTRVAAGAATAAAAFNSASASQFSLAGSQRSSNAPSRAASTRSLGGASDRPASASASMSAAASASAAVANAGRGIGSRKFLPTRSASKIVPVYARNSASASSLGVSVTGDASAAASDDEQQHSARPRSATSASQCDHCGKATSIIRTIYLPNENADSMKTIIESLRRQLAEHTKLAAEQKQAFQEDRRIREQEANLHLAAYQEKIKRLEDGMRLQQDINHRTMKDYFKLRYDFRVKEEQALSEQTLNKEEIKKLRFELDNFDNSAAIREREVHARMRQEQAEYTDQFRKQVLDREENACIIKEQYAATQKMYESRMQYLTEQNTTLRDKCRALEKRRNLQAEGLGSEITQLRTSIKALERRLTQVKLVARHRVEEAKLSTEPEFLAIEELLQRINDQLAAQ